MALLCSVLGMMVLEWQLFRTEYDASRKYLTCGLPLCDKASLLQLVPTVFQKKRYLWFTQDCNGSNKQIDSQSRPTIDLKLLF
jgi:hypothetical protein